MSSTPGGGDRKHIQPCQTKARLFEKSSQWKFITYQIPQENLQCILTEKLFDFLFKQSFSFQS